MNITRTTSVTTSRRLCRFAWVCALVMLTQPCDAAPRKPKRQEPAPDITAQILEQRLADNTLSPADRSRLSVALASDYYRLKEFDQEAEVLENALAAGIADSKVAADAHYYLGRTYESLGAADLAANEFLTVWEHYPDSGYHLHAAMEIGDLMLQGSNLVEATEWYEAVRDLQPKGKLGFLARDKLRAMAQGVSAEEITDESRRPIFEKEQLRRLDQYLYSQLYDKANALALQLTSAATNAQMLAAMSYHLAHHFWMYGDVDGADGFLASALQTTGERHVHALLLAGHIQRALGRTDAALSYYEQAITAAPKEEMTITAYQQSTRLLSRDGRQADALALAAAGSQAYTNTPQFVAYLERITTTLRDRASPQWKDYAAQVAAASDGDAGRHALMQLARDARLHNDWPAAEQLYRQLVTRQSKDWRSNVDMLTRLMDVQLQQTNRVAAVATEKALLSFSQGLPTDDAKSYTLYRLGKVWSASGDAARAETRWRQVLANYPTTRVAGMAQVQLAQYYEGSGDLTNAVSIYEAFLKTSEIAPRYKLRAYANLFRLKNALGDPVSASSMLDTARELALQANDAELQLSLAQYFLKHSDPATAQQLLDAGISNAEAMIRAEHSAQRRLWWEYLIARRLDDFQQFGRLADRAARIEAAVVENPLLDESMRTALYCYLMRALEHSGRWTEAEALCQKAIRSTPEDSDHLAHVLYRLSLQAKKQGNSDLAGQFATEAFREQPTSYISQYMYLHAAVEDFKAGQYAAALGKIAELEQAVPVSRMAPKTWSADFRWDCQYMKGRCLKAMGNETSGQQLMSEAMAQKHSVAQLYDFAGPSPRTQR